MHQSPLFNIPGPCSISLVPILLQGSHGVGFEELHLALEAGRIGRGAVCEEQEGDESGAEKSGEGPAGAAEDTSFYAGRTLTIFAGLPPGGGVDGEMRVLAQHFSKYIPGHPVIVARNMPGAGGIVLGNYINSVAAADGLTARLDGARLRPSLGAGRASPFPSPKRARPARFRATLGASAPPYTGGRACRNPLRGRTHTRREASARGGSIGARTADRSGAIPR